jgi:type II secretory pathway component PulK
MRRRSARRSGFAMVMAIFMLSFTVVAAAALNSALFFQARRVRLLDQNSQLRQLLLAGTEIARARLASPAPRDGQWTVDLPDSLKEQEARLIIAIQSAGSPNKVVAEVDASLPGCKLSQRVQLAEANGVWKVISANLGD